MTARLHPDHGAKAPTNPVASHKPGQARRVQLASVLGWLTAAVALLSVFLWYLSPHLVVEMAGRFWSCI